ncbi:ABC transporter substrate-binding protein [Aquincola sp. S2]|uniref:ABC transporter substrate-binding protein n=2 Tax=Pseudaquabacterium terrae TaxID=2732868 RepID=A0ABX2EM06_9BURK|nr:ABC transporter substrate-binding protein [Aquabacterium terrae]NRF69705.1 ABC transporter substrate-binding protein [Aquabacterium terrae]
MVLSTWARIAGGWVLAVAGAAYAQPLTLANFGGANGQAQAVAFVQPFARQQGFAVTTAETSGDLAPIRAMVQAKAVRWDVIEVESTELALGCAEGLFERIDRTKLAHGSLMLPGSVHDCGVGAFVWSTVLAYDGSKLKRAPATWADFWDVARFPGKRALRKGARYNLEFALMADGVHRRDVYAVLATEAGQARALAKLETLRPHIVWWESGAQPPQWLAAGEVVMASAFNGRIGAARQAGATQMEIVWNDAIYELDYWAIVKGTKRRAEALAFIDHATSPEAQLAFSRAIPYGPTHFHAILKYEEGRKPVAGNAHGALIDLSMTASDLPSAPANLRRALPFSAAFWSQRGAALEQRLGQRAVP